MDLKDLYRQVILDHSQRPRYKGFVEDDSRIKLTNLNPSCGDVLSIQLKIEDGTITDARHDGKGCSICCSSASILCCNVIGRSVDQALEMGFEFEKMVMGNEFNQELIVDELLAFNTVSQYPARIKCATLSWKALMKIRDK
jgi:nitrogen fixation NifU-like protein